MDTKGMDEAEAWAEYAAIIYKPELDTHGPWGECQCPRHVKEWAAWPEKLAEIEAERPKPIRSEPDP